MDLTQFKELGIAGITVAGIATLFFFVTKALLTEIKTARENYSQDITKAREDYSSFVLSNNHNSTDLMRENIETLVEVKNAMENHNKVLEKLLAKLDK
jgi:coenzyme F420-reducing hydrogenase alpha subunit